MILTCPECATSYFVDDSRISTAGRTVKCSNCGARWTALPAGAEEIPAPAPVPPKPTPPPAAAPLVDELVIGGPPTAAEAMKERRAIPPRREANAKVMILGGSAVAAVLLIAGAIAFRAQVVQLAPATRAAYAGVGLAVSSLVIEQVRADPAFQGGRPVLSVTGQIRNLRDVAADAPPLRVSLLDRLGKAVAVKVARPIDAAVPARAVRHFAISIVDPPAALHDLEVTFEPPGKGAPKATVPVTASANVAPAGPQPAEAKSLPPGSPDALAPHP